MNAAKQLALAAEALYAAGFRGRANKLRRVADELALTEAAFDGIHAQLAAVSAERDALAAKVERVRALHYRRPHGVLDFVAHGQIEFPDLCDYDRAAWPCPTVRALGEADR